MEAFLSLSTLSIWLSQMLGQSFLLLPPLYIVIVHLWCTRCIPSPSASASLVLVLVLVLVLAACCLLPVSVVVPSYTYSI